MADIIQNPALGDIIIVNGVPTIDFYTWIEQVNRAVNNIAPLVGVGTPEGSVIASAGRWYVDTAALVGEGIYLKESGDGDTGWAVRS